MLFFPLNHGFFMRSDRPLPDALLLVLCLVFAAGCSPAPEPARPGPKPDRPAWIHPNEADLKRLGSVKGQSAARVLEILGHPVKVEKDENGERWLYPWLGAAVVYFDNGVATGTFYTGGF